VYEDTPPEQLRRYHDKLRALSASARMEVVVALSRAVRELAEAGIRQRHPEASDHEVRMRLAVRLYGRQTAERLFGRVPDDAT
jgi:hypothetical protein